MTLREIVERLELLDDELTIYAEGGPDARPSSEAVVAMMPEDGSPPEAAGEFDYLLEIFLACEVLEEWCNYHGLASLSTDEKCELILHYAKHDALPAS
jgi:hypothetical protein